MGKRGKNMCKLISIVALLGILITLLPAVPANAAAAGNSTATLTEPPEGGTVKEVTTVTGTVYDPDGVTGVSIAIQNAQGDYLQDPDNGPWSPGLKVFTAQVTPPTTGTPQPDNPYTWVLSVNKLLFTEGTYTVTILVNDGANIDYLQKSFKVDATGPVLSNPVPQPGSFIAGSSGEHFAITATDTPAGVYTVELVYRIGTTGTEVTVSLVPAASGNMYQALVDLSTTSVGDVVYYRFQATDKAGNTSASPSLTDWYTVTVDKQPPAEVTNLTVTSPPEGGKLVLSWTDPPDADYAQAKVYYSVIPGGSWTCFGSVARGQQTFTIAGLDPSGTTKYAVKVTTVDNFGNESQGVVDDNKGQGYVAKDVKPPAEVSNLKVSIVPAGGALELEWANPVDADYAGAKIYFKKLADSSWAFSGTVSSTVYQYQINDLVNGVPYAVKVTTFDLYGNESAGIVDDNNGRGYIPTDTEAPGEVTGARATALPSGGVILLTWADPVAIDLNHVKVYMREKGSTSWGNAISVPKGIGHYEFTNLDRTGQTRYEFKISVVDAAYNESPGIVLDNNGQGYSARDTVPPSEPTSLVVTVPAQGGSLKVEWSDPFDVDLDHINVYYRPVGTTGDAWGTPQKVAKGIGSCLITGLANGHAYELKITAVDDIGNESRGVILDNNGQGYLPAQTPVDTTPPGEVSNLTVVPQPGPGVFRISFTAPSDQDLAGVAVYVAVYGSNNWYRASWGGSSVYHCLPGESVTITLGVPGNFVLGSDKVQFKIEATDNSGNASPGVVADNNGEGYSVLARQVLIPGPEGWVTFSVPVQLAGDQKLLGNVIDLDKVEIAYKFDAAAQRWVQVTADCNTIQPLEAVYIKLKGPALAAIKPVTAPTNPPVRELSAGWNLIGVTKGDNLDSALYSVRGRWSVAVSPGVNPMPWAVTPQGAAGVMVMPHFGYWVYMDEPGKLVGFTSTPVTVGTYPY